MSSAGFNATHFQTDMLFIFIHYFRHIGLNKRAIALPSLKNDHKLPVILNRSELKELFKAQKLLKHRIMSNRFAWQTAMYRKQSTKPEGETTIQRIKRLTGIDVSCCPYCKKGKMLTVEIIPRIRSPVKFFRPKEKSKTL